MINDNLNLYDNHHNLYTIDDIKMLENFNNLSSMPIIQLSNENFKNGTFRIIKSGIYKLTENIIFSPNSNIYTSLNCHDLLNVLDNFHPTESQKSDYPTPPYQFGFFAAITIECDNVILDLNGFSIEQSMLHYIHQRFFSCIELNKSPFIKKQGPSDFGDAKGINGDFPNNIYIKNGILGRSSHHGIHGNGNKNVLIENLIIKDFEVCGIAINGGENIICRFIDLPNSLQNVPINFLYSNSLYTRRFLYQLWDHDPEAYININGEEKIFVKEVICQLQSEMIENVYIPLLENREIKSELFKNKSDLPEGNIYALVFNGLGVVVNDFIVDNTGVLGNKNIIIHDINIKNIDSFPREILGLTDIDGLHKGTVGNIMPYLIVTDIDNGYIYKSNPVTNATVILSKYKQIDSSFNIRSKSLNIPLYMINEWFEKKTDINLVIKNNNLKYVNLRDQMAHYMKGNIMVFISGANNTKVKNINLNNIKNSGLECDCQEDRIQNYKYIFDNKEYPNFNLYYADYKGDDIVAILIAGSKNVECSNIECNNINTDNGLCVGIKIVGKCEEINNNNINIKEHDKNEIVNKNIGFKIGVNKLSKMVLYGFKNLKDTYNGEDYVNNMIHKKTYLLNNTELN